MSLYLSGNGLNDKFEFVELFAIYLHEESKFNQKLDKKTVYDNITFNFDVKLSEKNCTIAGNRITLFNLPVEAGETYSVTLKNGIKDIYGQSLSDKSAVTYEIEMPDSSKYSYVEFIDNGVKANIVDIHVL